MESLSPESPPSVKACPRCTASILENALYCGNCGFSIAASDQNDAPGFQNDHIVEQKTLWQWISPAIGLWVILLVINGVIGLLGHFRDISSPYFDMGTQLLLVLFILIPCVVANKQLRPLLSSFGHRGVLSYLEIIGALILIYAFMRLYFKVAALIGVEKLSYLSDYTQHGWPIWSAFIIACIIPGVFEELAFRGFIMSRLEKVGSVREALIIQAAMFSVLHMFPAIFISHFIIGIILGAVRLRSGSLYPGMLIHAVWNGIAIAGEAYHLSSITC